MSGERWYTTSFRAREFSAGWRYTTPATAAGRMATLAPPAPGADPGPSHRVCPRGLWHLSYRGIRSADGGQTQGCGAGDWHTPGNPGQVWPSTRELILMLAPHSTLAIQESTPCR